jgi:hypothetical protein
LGWFGDWPDVVMFVIGVAPEFGRPFKYADIFVAASLDQLARGVSADFVDQCACINSRATV